jgi:hypothetical protein
MFRDMTPCSLVGSERTIPLFLLPAFTLVSCSAYSLTLEMEATYSSETSVDFQRNTQPYIPEDRTLHDHRCENLNSYKSRPCSVSIHRLAGRRKNTESPSVCRFPLHNYSWVPSEYMEGILQAICPTCSQLLKITKTYWLN